MNPRQLIVAITAILASNIASSVDVQSVSSRPSLEEVVVTATRRQEDLQSVPGSIAAVTAGELDARGITAFSELSEVVSGLDLQQPFSAGSAAVYVRGVGTAGSSPADRSVGVIVDGVYQLRPGAVFTEMLDVERVEVLRGPQGTLFGRNTTAGAIKIETAIPDTDSFSGRVQGVYGNLNNTEFRGFVNIPIVKDVLAARVSGYKAERDGYTRNVFYGKDTRDTDREGWRAKLLWNASDNFRLTISADSQKENSLMDQALIAYSADHLERFSDILPPVSLGDYQEDTLGKISLDIDRYILRAEWDFLNHSLTSISAYDKSSYRQSVDLDATVLSGLELGQNTVVALTNQPVTKSLVQEIQLSSNWDKRFDYILGLYWQSEDVVSTTVMETGSGAILPRPPSEFKVESRALFGSLNFDLSDQWRTSIGVRYTEDEKQGTNNLFDGATTFEEWTYSFKIVYEINPDLMLYAAHDKGFKSGGVNREFSLCGRGGACLDSGQVFWDPETTLNYELGLKSEWLDSRLRFNAAVFLQDYEDFQVLQTGVGVADVLVTNAAEVRSRGVEAEFVGIVTDNFTVSGNIAFIKNKYKKYDNAPCAVLSSSGCLNGSQDLSGKVLDNAPELSYSVAAEYRNTLSSSAGMEWFSRLDVVYTDDVNLHVLLSPETEQSSYYIVNTALGIESENWKVTLWGKNMFDENYKAWSELSSQGLRAVPGLPRTWGVTADWFF